MSAKLARIFISTVNREPWKIRIHIFGGIFFNGFETVKTHRENFSHTL